MTVDAASIERDVRIGQCRWRLRIVPQGRRWYAHVTQGIGNWDHVITARSRDAVARKALHAIAASAAASHAPAMHVSIEVVDGWTSSDAPGLGATPTSSGAARDRSSRSGWGRAQRLLAHIAFAGWRRS